VTCTVTPAGGLAAGASLPNISVTVNPKPAAVPSVTNTATVANANDIDPDNDSSSSVTGIDVVADLAITKTDGTASVAVGGSTTYTLIVTNGGPSSVTGAILADPAVASLTKTAVACAPTPGQCVSPPSIVQLQAGTFALPPLASGQTYRLSVSADVTAVSGSVTNTATIAAPSGTTDPDGTNNSASDTDTVTPAAVEGLTLAKGASPMTYTAAGDVIAYTYVVTNSGGLTLAGPFIVADNKTIVTCPATATLAIGASITCTATYTIIAADVTAGSVTNVATASSADGTTSNEDTVTVVAVAAPPPTLPPTPPNTGAQATAGLSAVDATGWLGVLAIVSIVAAASVLGAGWMRRRRS
jgi:uncharacterized repeat protein (TIGR01451 family)